MSGFPVMSQLFVLPGRGYPGESAIRPDPHHAVHLLLLPPPRVQPAQRRRVQLRTPDRHGHGERRTSQRMGSLTGSVITMLLPVPQVKAGLGANIIGVLATLLAVATWGVPLFSLDTYPDWAPVHPGSNSTSP